MTALAISALLLMLLMVASVIGFRLQRHLPEAYHSRDRIASIRVIITMLVTFAALVLVLLVSSVKAGFAHRRHADATARTRSHPRSKVISQSGKSATSCT